MVISHVSKILKFSALLQNINNINTLISHFHNKIIQVHSDNSKRKQYSQVIYNFNIFLSLKCNKLLQNGNIKNKT